MKYGFTEIFDIPELTHLCERFTELNGTVTALLDLEGNVHVKTGWQRVCTDFHRVNPCTSSRCTESDTVLAAQLEAGRPYNMYKCKNGLVDVAVPVMIDGIHVGNFFTGQFLLEKPDERAFAKQAKVVGLDELQYLDALKEVPIFTEAEVEKSMRFLVALTEAIGKMGKRRLDQLKALEGQKDLLEKLVAARTAELEAMNLKLEELALQDPLTRLSNRRRFEERAQTELARMKRHLHKLSLAIIDADHFKQINDTYGHDIGDEVLITIADNVRTHIRETDDASRFGGEEFCMLLPNCGFEEGVHLLERLRLAIEKHEFAAGEERFNVTCSFGLAEADGTCADYRELVRKADTALYQAKAEGRNRIKVYKKSPDCISVERHNGQTSNDLEGKERRRRADRPIRVMVAGNGKEAKTELLRMFSKCARNSDEISLQAHEDSLHQELEKRACDLLFITGDLTHGHEGVALLESINAKHGQYPAAWMVMESISKQKSRAKKMGELRCVDSRSVKEPLIRHAMATAAEGRASL